MYRINLQPEEPALDGAGLNLLIKQWLEEEQAHLPADTVQGYAVKLAYFSKWWGVCGIANGWKLSKLTLAQFNRWLTDVARTKHGGPLSYHTRNDVLRRMKQMFRWAKATGRIPADLSDWIPAAEGSAPLRVAPDISAVERLLSAAQAYGPRDVALMATLLGTGIRRAEAVGLDVTDVTLYADLSGTLAVRKAKKVTGRIVQARLVAFDAATGYYIAQWLDCCPPAGPLFPSGHPGHEGEHLTPDGLYRLVRRSIVDAGLGDVIQGPHDLRRLFATTFARYRRGADFASLLSKQLGHSAYSMTAHYVLSDVSDIREALVSPVAIAGADSHRSPR